MKFAFMALSAMYSWGALCPVSTAQAIKASVASAPLKPTSSSQWLRDLGYRETQLYPLSLSGTGCPSVDVELAGVKETLLLDTGMARGFLVTDHAPPFPHRLEQADDELNADGSHRGRSQGLRVETISVLGETFKDRGGALADWKMFSSSPFDGAVGLDFFLGRRISLDYHAGKAGVTTAALPRKLARERYLCLDLVDPPAEQGHILYTRAKVNHRDAIVYLDTGYNVSFIDPSFAEGLERVERPGKFKVFRQRVPVELAGRTFLLDDLRESPIERGGGFDQPVALTLGSDVLSRFIVTIDVRAKKLILALAQ